MVVYPSPPPYVSKIASQADADKLCKETLPHRDWDINYQYSDRRMEVFCHKGKVIRIMWHNGNQ